MHFKTLILLTTMLLSYSVKAQKYRLSFEQSGNFSVYNFTTDFPYSIPGRDLKPRLGFESELRFSYTPKKKIALYTGIGFKKYNYTYGKFEARYSDQTIPRNGFDPSTSEQNFPTHININYSYNYLNIPLGIQYSPTQKLVFAIGVDVLRKLSVYSYSKYWYPNQWAAESNYNKKTFNNQGYANWVLSTHAEVGYIVPILKYNITWKAVVEYAATNFFAKEHPKLHLNPYTFNLGVSLPILVKN